MKTTVYSGGNTEKYSFVCMLVIVFALAVVERALRLEAFSPLGWLESGSQSVTTRTSLHQRQVFLGVNIDHFMVGERVRFLFTSCEE